MELRKIDARIKTVPRESLLAQLKLRLLLRDRLLEAQKKDVEVGKIRDKVKSGVETSFHILEDGIIAYRRQMILLEDETLQREVLREAHESRLVTHPGSTKMYRDLEEFYWWPNMKRKVTIWPSVKCVNR